jgi:hypothetical protein
MEQFPDLLNGKTLLYVHGFASSGQSGTVKRLRNAFPNANVIAPDLPVHPEEAIALLHQVCADVHPDIILGTSMGGMYAEQLYGYDRILTNPALCIADTMAAHGLTGTQTFQNPRQDGQQTFYVDKALVKAYRTVSERRFSGLTTADGQPSPTAADERRRVYGLFGDADTLVDTFDLFHQHYPNAISFHGEHRMDDHSFVHSVLPVIRWVDDRQEHRDRPIIYIGIETLLNHGGPMHLDTPPASSAQKAVRQLIARYQLFFVAPALTAQPSLYATTTAWLQQYVNVPAWGHTIFTNQRHLLYGDYLVEALSTADTLATRLEFGSDTFKSWDDLITYFDRLGL